MAWYHRICFFCLIVGFLYIGWWPVAGVYAVWLWYLTVPYEFLLIGFMMDGYFGVPFGLFWYTSIGLFLNVTALYIKPLLYTNSFKMTQ